MSAPSIGCPASPWTYPWIMIPRDILIRIWCSPCFSIEGMCCSVRANSGCRTCTW